MELTDKVWQQLDGGYKTPYDASVLLIRLEKTDDPKMIDDIWKALWNELHHQGDVGIASYLALPQLARIGIKNDLFDWNLLGICAVIEQQRHLGNNPDLPIEFQDYYKKGLADLKVFVIKNLNNDLDITTTVMALSTIATCDGHIKIGKSIMEMADKDLLNEFLEQF
jgi:hypothetical protein